MTITQCVFHGHKHESFRQESVSWDSDLLLKVKFHWHAAHGSFTCSWLVWTVAAKLSTVTETSLWPFRAAICRLLFQDMGVDGKGGPQGGIQMVPIVRLGTPITHVTLTQPDFFALLAQRQGPQRSLVIMRLLTLMLSKNPSHGRTGKSM